MADLDTIRKAAADLCDSLREVGLYVDADHDVQVHELPDGRHYVLLDATIGDLAFSDRVQNPEQHDVDAEFRKMTRAGDADRFLDARAEVERRIAEATGGPT